MINTMEINPDELAGLDLFQNCRLCLAKEKVSVDIFSDGAEVRLLYYKIISCLPVQVTQEDDKLPKKICMTCNEKVDTFYQFWTLTAKTQKTLIDWAQQKDVITTKIKTENVPPGEMSFKQETIDYSDDNDNDDHYDDDNSDDDVEPSAIVKVCEETDEAGTSATAHIKSEEENPEKNQKKIEYLKSNMNLILKKKISKKNVRAIKRLKRSIFSQLNIGMSKKKSSQEMRKKGIIHGLQDNQNPDSNLKLMLENVPMENSNAETSNFSLTLEEKAIKRTLNEIDPCKQCGYKHFKTRNCNKIELPFSCNICSRSFKMKKYLYRHQQIHLDEKQFTCNYCDRSFRTKDSIVTHMKYIHLGMVRRKPPKPHQCTLCTKSFASQRQLDDHQFVHTGVKTYACDICGKLLANHKGLIEHKRSVHETKPDESSKKTYVCHICGAILTTPQSQRRHLKLIHGDGKPECHICGKTVSTKEFLITHLNMHLGIKPYSCDVCGHSFTSIKYLKLHMRNHTGETPFSCKMCSRGFKQRSALTGHIKSKHPDYIP